MATNSSAPVLVRARSWLERNAVIPSGLSPKELETFLKKEKVKVVEREKASNGETLWVLESELRAILERRADKAIEPTDHISKISSRLTRMETSISQLAIQVNGIGSWTQQFADLMAAWAKQAQIMNAGIERIETKLDRVLMELGVNPLEIGGRHEHQRAPTD